MYEVMGHIHRAGERCVVRSSDSLILYFLSISLDGVKGFEEEEKWRKKNKRQSQFPRPASSLVVLHLFMSSQQW